MGKRSKQARKQRQPQDIGNSLSYGQVPRSLVNRVSNSLRTTFTDIVPLTCGVDGSAPGSNSLSFTTNDGGSTIGSTMSRAGTVSALYRQYMFNKLTIRWIPYASFQTAGNFAMGVDDDPATSNSTQSISLIYHHRPSVVSDLKSPSEIVYIPGNSGKTDPLYVNKGANGIAIGQQDISYGRLVWNAATGLTSAQQIGMIEYILDVTFIGPV